MSNNHTQRRKEAEAVIALLVEHFPKCFAVYERRRRPLKVGIHRDILATLDGAILADELSNALRTYCANSGYLRSMRIGAPRITSAVSPQVLSPLRRRRVQGRV